jgi:hypothetical protein
MKTLEQKLRDLLRENGISRYADLQNIMNAVKDNPTLAADIGDKWADSEDRMPHATFNWLYENDIRPIVLTWLRAYRPDVYYIDAFLPYRDQIALKAVAKSRRNK